MRNCSYLNIRPSVIFGSIHFFNMKSITIVFAVFTLIVFLSSCQKIRHRQNDQTILVNEAYSANISSDETYSFHLPASSNPFYISQPAQHATHEAITRTSTSYHYSYTPASGFIGTETIILSNQMQMCDIAKEGGCGTQETSTLYEYSLTIHVQDANK